VARHGAFWCNAAHARIGGMDRSHRLNRRGWLALASSAWLPAQALADPTPEEPLQLTVELSTEWRRMAGQGGGLSKVERALVTVVRPPAFDASADWPVLVVNATSDRGYSSSRALLQAYRAAAAEAGWVIVAADPEPAVSQDEDLLGLRYVLGSAALAAVRPMWKGAERARVAFAGFSGGAKYAGWLAALFHKQGTAVIGAYMAGVNTNAIGEAAQKFGLERDEPFHRVPIFLQGGQKDRVATPAQHQGIETDLKRDGFKQVRLAFVPGPHAVDASLLADALRWFAAPAAQAPAASDAGR
jgi:hypothetical protein